MDRLIEVYLQTTNIDQACELLGLPVAAHTKWMREYECYEEEFNAAHQRLRREYFSGYQFEDDEDLDSELLEGTDLEPDTQLLSAEPPGSSKVRPPRARPLASRRVCVSASNVWSRRLAIEFF